MSLRRALPRIQRESSTLGTRRVAIEFSHASARTAHPAGAAWQRSLGTLQTYGLEKQHNGLLQSSAYQRLLCCDPNGWPQLVEQSSNFEEWKTEAHKHCALTHLMLLLDRESFNLQIYPTTRITKTVMVNIRQTENTLTADEILSEVSGKDSSFHFLVVQFSLSCKTSSTQSPRISNIMEAHVQNYSSSALKRGTSSTPETASKKLKLRMRPNNVNVSESARRPAVNPYSKEAPILLKFKVPRPPAFTFTSSGWTTINPPAPKPTEPTSQTSSNSSALGFTDEELAQMKTSKRIAWKACQERCMALWLKNNNAISMRRHEDAYSELLQTFRLTIPELAEEFRRQLDVKARSKLWNMGKQMKKDRAMKIVNKSLPNEAVIFASWTDGWLSPSWDGSTEEPADWTPLFDEDEDEADSWNLKEERFEVEDSQLSDRMGGEGDEQSISHSAIRMYV